MNTPQVPGHSVTNTNYGDVSPRFEFAYALSPKTTLRGWTYELPVGKRKGLLGGAHGGSDILISHWQLRGIVTLMSGQYFTPVSGLQFRAELFNIFNTPQFNNYSATIGVNTAGTISSAGDTYSYQRTSRLSS